MRDLWNLGKKLLHRIHRSIDCAPAIMKAFLILVCTATAAFAAESPEQNRLVLIGVFDDVTKSPVAGVKVSAEYFSSAHPEKVTVGDEGVTDQKGIAVLRARYDGDKPPHFTAAVNRLGYEFNGSIFPSVNDVKRITARAPSEKPNKIDVIFLISSASTETARREEKKKKLAVASREVERLYRDEPDYWPSKGAEPYPWAQGDSAMELIAKRWNGAGKNPIGGPSDAAEIRKVVRLHMKRSDAQVGEVRWINTRTVMAMSSWYEGPLASATFTYVLKKNAKGKWRVLTYYMESVS